ncbi:MAG: WYL domain-containing protein, partial [Deltaproteobacteria bacterium]|nr:WYL domain-containing protein [Deltaproteobacteria bacterium]
KKLDAFMPEGLANRLDQVKTLFVPSSKFTKDYCDKEDVIEQLTDAIFRQQTCVVEYHSFHDDKTKGFKIDPLRFFERDGGLYLFVRATSYGHIRVLAVERINKLSITKETFTLPKDFDPDGLLEDAFSIVFDDPFEVKIRFSQEVARYIRERRWAKDQSITDNPDGSILLELRTSGWLDVKRWILSFGAKAEVIEPENLKKEIMEELFDTVNSYSKRQ